MIIVEFKTHAKLATNIFLSVDVYNEAKAMGINLSQTCERLLEEVIEQKKAENWAAQHAEFIGAYNAFVESEELPLNQWRSF